MWSTAVPARRPYRQAAPLQQGTPYCAASGTASAPRAGRAAAADGGQQEGESEFILRLSLKSSQNWQEGESELQEVERQLAKAPARPGSRDKDKPAAGDSEAAGAPGGSGGAAAAPANGRAAAAARPAAARASALARRLVSPVLLEAFALTFLAEWGDRSQARAPARAGPPGPRVPGLAASLGVPWLLSALRCSWRSCLPASWEAFANSEGPRQAGACAPKAHTTSPWWLAMAWL